MSIAEFVHLRVHSAYSLSEGAIRIGDLPDLCARSDMPAVAVTDTNNLFGVLEFSQTMAAKGIQPILGCQLAFDAGRIEGGREHGSASYPSLVLLVQNEQGYRNLLKLSSAAYLDTPSDQDPHVSLELLEECAEGLICFSGGPLGAVNRLLLASRRSAAADLTRHLAAMFPGRFYIELQRHGLAAEAEAEPHLLDFAYDFDLPLIATNDVYFPDEDMYDAHDALLCVAEGAYIISGDRRRVTPEHRFKSSAEMAALFADLPEAVANTLVVARRCAYMAPTRAPILPRFDSGEGRSEAEELRHRARQGLEQRLQKHVYEDGMDEAAREEAARPYRERLDYELDIIIKMDFPGYFLIVADFIQWAKNHGIPVGPGRGSGAGSLVAWALTITDLDPLRLNLLFERFLNPERVSMPDFDIDFCQDRRDEVIHYVQEKYGYDQVAQIITFGKLQARAALRDVGRVLQMPFPQVDRICKLVPNNPGKPVTIAEAMNMEERLREEKRSDEDAARMIDLAMKIEGLYRHASTHAAGVVIGDRPLVELVPLYRDPRSDMPVTQLNMKFVEKAGLVKFDFLGLKTLTVLERAVRLIAARPDGVQIDLSAIPLDDRKTFEMLSRGETVGVFQLESAGMRDVLCNLKPDNFGDIIAVVALYRPGPMDNIPKYIATKHGEEKPDYLHPWLEDILKETYGIIIYQEQVMQIAQVLAGYTLGEADLLRRAMGKKIQAEMDAQRARFVSGAVAKGVDEKQADYIFDLVNKFAGYGFNKSHAAAYALVAWQTAYLKANYPVEFLAATMSLDLTNTDKLNTFRQDLQRLGAEVLPPDINRSEVDFIVEYPDGPDSGKVRYALSAIRNVGQEAMRAVIAERRANGPFRDLFDFAARLDPAVLNKRQMENLVRAGAFDSLHPNRHEVLHNIDVLSRYSQLVASEKASNQSSLFGAPGGDMAPPPPLKSVSPWPEAEKLAEEFSAIGFYLSAHPLDSYGRQLRQKGVRSFADLARSRGGGNVVRLAGTVLGKQERVSAKGARYAFITASDASGMFEVALFSEVYDAARDMIEVGQSYVFVVEPRQNEDRLRLTARRIIEIDDYVADAAAGALVHLSSADALPGLVSILQGAGQGRGQVHLLIRLHDMSKEVEMKLQGGYAISPTVCQAMKAVRGVADVQLV